MNELIERFKSLEDAQQRDSTLRRLVCSLTKSELRGLTSMISERNDIVCMLPIELVLKVFHHLHVLSAWKLQLVCRRWRSVLSSHDFLRMRLAQEGHIRPGTAPFTGDSADDDIRRAVRHMQALRLGRPFSYYLSCIHLARLAPGYRSGPLHEVTLHEHAVAWVSESDDATSKVVVRDLVTGQERSFCGEAREKIMCIALTDKLLAFVSFSGMLYVATLNATDTRPMRLRLPSIGVIAVAIDGFTVALLLDRTTIAMYSGSSKKFTAYRFTLQMNDNSAMVLFPRNLVLDSSRNTIDVFSCTVKTALHEPTATYVGHMRLRLNSRGSQNIPLELLASSVVEIVSPRPLLVGSIQPLEVVGLFRVQLNKDNNEWTILQDMSVMFNARTTDLYLKRHPISSHIRPRNYGDSQEGTNRLNGTLLRWREGFYCIGVGEMIMTMFEEHDKVKRQSTLLYRSSLELREQEQLRCSEMAAFMNDTCIVLFALPRLDGPGRISVFWFDERLPLADGRSTGLWRSEDLQSEEDRDHCKSGYGMPFSRQPKDECSFRFHSCHPQKLPFQDI